MTHIARLAALVACALAVVLVVAPAASAAGGGHPCGRTEATDKNGDTAKFKVKQYDTGCQRAERGVRRYYRQTNGERGRRIVIRGYRCGPLQAFDRGELAFQCRKTGQPAKRYKAFWISKN